MMRTSDRIIAAATDHKIEARSPVRKEQFAGSKTGGLYANFMGDGKAAALPRMFSPARARSRTVHRINATRRVNSAKKMRSIRARIAGVRTAMKASRRTGVPPSDFDRPTVSRLRFFDAKGDDNTSSVPEGPSTPLVRPLSRSVRGTVTPLSVRLQQAYKKAEEQFPAKIAKICFAPAAVAVAASPAPGSPAVRDENADPACNHPVDSLDTQCVDDEAEFDEPPSPVETKRTAARATPMKSSIMTKLDLVVSSVHAGPGYGRYDTRVNKIPVRRSLRLARKAREARD